MNKQNFSTEQYTLKHYDHEQSEVVFAGDRSSSDIIVFIHGAMMTYRIMAMFEPYFREYQMNFVNCPGRGESSELTTTKDTLDDYSERIYDVLSQVVEQHGIKKMMLLGYSMGGMIATRLLKFNTLPITHLVYLNSAARITPNTSMLSRLFSGDSKREHLKDEMAAIKNLPQYILDKTVYAKTESAKDIFSFLAPVKTILTDIEYSIKADYLPDIEEIEQFPKLLFISGEDDEIIPYTDSHETLLKYQKFGGTAVEVVYPGIGHLDFPTVLESQEDDTKGIVDQIKAWVAS